MKTKILILIGTLILMVVSIDGMAQKQKPHKPGGGREEGLKEVKSITGEIVDWTYNNNYVYDGFYLKSKEGTYYVKFAPHFGKQIRNAGKTVTVDGILSTSQRDKEKYGNKINFINIISNGDTIAKRDYIHAGPKAKASTIVDHVDPNSPDAGNTTIKVGKRKIVIESKEPAGRKGNNNEDTVSGSGKVVQIFLNENGILSGYLLDNNTILRIPRHVAGQLSQLIQFETNIQYEGVKKDLKEGEVAAKDYTIVHCNIITVNGTKYLVR